MGLLYRVPFLEMGNFVYRRSAAVTSGPAASCEDRCRKIILALWSLLPVTKWVFFRAGKGSQACP